MDAHAHIHGAIARIRAHLNARRNAREGATRGPWSADLERGAVWAEDTTPIAWIHPHASVHTATATGQEFSHADARAIVAHTDPDTAEALDRVLEAMLAAVEVAVEWHGPPCACVRCKPLHDLIAAAEALPSAWLAYKRNRFARGERTRGLGSQKGKERGTLLGVFSTPEEAMRRVEQEASDAE